MRRVHTLPPALLGYWDAVLSSQGFASIFSLSIAVTYAISNLQVFGSPLAQILGYPTDFELHFDLFSRFFHARISPNRPFQAAAQVYSGTFPQRLGPGCSKGLPVIEIRRITTSSRLVDQGLLQDIPGGRGERPEPEVGAMNRATLAAVLLSSLLAAGCPRPPQTAAPPLRESTLLPTMRPATPVPPPTARPPAPAPVPTGARTGQPLRYDPRGPDRNCADFSTWAEAQDFYEASLQIFGYDRHRLDADSDGIACERLRRRR